MKIKNTLFKLSLLSSALLLASYSNAFELAQSGNELISDKLENTHYQANVRTPDGETISFKINNKEFVLTPELLGLSAFEDGLYKYELTPIMPAGSMAQDVRSLQDTTLTKEYTEVFQSKAEILTGVFSMNNEKLVDSKLKDPSEMAGIDTTENAQQQSSDNDNGNISSALGTTRDNVINDDVIITQSLCVGNDCVNGESFGFDTLRLKENNLRIRAQDTSNSASFPSRDWQITFNDTSNGGANKFSIDDIDGGRTPFTIEAGAPSNSLYVEDGGRVGFGTNVPVVDLHVKSGNTPTLRLEQDGSSGFGAQIWDVAGNEANFFIRDASNGSTLPFRIFPGAPTSSISIANGGNVGVGIQTATAKLQVAGDLLVRDSDATTNLTVEETDTGSNFLTMLNLTNNGTGGIAYRMTTNGLSIDTNNTAGTYRINFADGDNQELELDTDGNLTIDGGITTGTMTYPDYVFEDDYKLLSLDEVKAFINENGHLPNVPSGDEMIKNGINLTDMHVKLMEKVEELTLYSLQQHDDINHLKAKIAQLEEK